MTKRQAHNLLAILVLLTFLAIFYRNHLAGKAYIPFDSKDQYYPFAVFVTQSYRAGEIPLWNPYIYSGTPAFADPLYTMFYPGTLLLLIPGYLSPQIYDIVEILHVLIGGISLFIFARQLQMPKQAALLSSGLFMLGGTMTARVQHVAQIYTISLLPLSLLLLNFGLTRKRRIFFVLAGLVTGIYMMIGYQVAILGFLVLLAFYFCFVIIRKPKGKERYSWVINLAIFCLVTVGISAIQVIPSLEFSGLSNRPRFDFLHASLSSISPSSLFTLIFPNIYNSIEGKYWGPGDVTETYLFVGAVSLLLAVIPIVKSWKKLKWEYKFFFFTAVLALLYALGKYTPIYFFFYHIFPPIQIFKRTSESFFIFNFALAMCAGIGLKVWLEQNLEFSQKEIFKFAVFLIMIYVVILVWGLSWVNGNQPEDISVNHWLRFWNLLPIIVLFIFIFVNQPLKRAASWILVGTIIIDLIATNSNIWINSTPQQFIQVSSTDIYGNVEVVEFLREHLGNEYRFETIHAGSLWPNAPAIWKFSSTLGYSPLIDRRYNEFAAPLGSQGRRNFSGLTNSYNSRLFDMMGVRYVISGLPLQEIDPNSDLSMFREVTGLGYNVYENAEALPLAFLVHQAKRVENENEAMAILTDEKFDPLETVVLELGPPSTQKNSMAKEQNSDLLVKDEVRIIKRSNNRITFQVSSPQEGYLVVTDVYYPGWKAYIDGMESEIMRANYTFKAVAVPVGNHVVELIFDPVSFKIGALISGSTIILTFLLLIYQLFFSFVNKKHRFHK